MTWPATPTFWTDEKIAELRKLRAGGASVSQIAKILGCTKGAASGKADRLGLQTPNKRSGRITSASTVPSAPRIRIQRETVAPVRQPTFINLDEPSRTERPWLERHGLQCRWPTSGEGADLWMCCAETAENRVYCPAHHKLGHAEPKGKVQPWRDRNVVNVTPVEDGDEAQPQPIDLEAA